MLVMLGVLVVIALWIQDVSRHAPWRFGAFTAIDERVIEF
jgi:hypothetical protein